MRTPLFSVIIAAYNAEEYIGECLASVFAQTFPDYEAIVVDDGSTDGTASAVLPYLSDSRFRLVRQENAGVSAARNHAIAKSRGDWIAILDSDDLWHTEKLEKQAELIHSNPSVSLAFTNCTFFSREWEWGPYYRRSSDMPRGRILPELLRGNRFAASSVVIKRREVIEAGGFNTSLATAEDYDLWLRVVERGGLVLGCWENLTRVRVNPGSLSRGGIRYHTAMVHLYEDAIRRLESSEMRKIAAASLAKARSDLLLSQAAQTVREPASRRGLSSHLYRAWRACPRRTTPLRLLATWIIGARNNVIRRLERWS